MAATALRTLGPTVVVALLGALLPWSSLFRPFDLEALDSSFAFLAARNAFRASSDIVVVGLDEQTVAGIPQPLALVHRQLGALLQILARSGARAVVLDVVLPDRSYDSIVPGYDLALLQGIVAMRRAGILVLARTVDEAGRERRVHAPFLAAAGADSSGLAVFPVDRDGVVRRFDERLGDHGGPVTTLVGEVARRLDVVVTSGLIDFAHPIGVAPLSMHTVLEQAEAIRPALTGRVVFVGALLPFVDRHRVPVPLTGTRFTANDTPGVYLQAQAFESLRNGRIALPAPWLSSLLGAALAAVAWQLSTTWRRAAAVAIVGIALLAIASAVLLDHGHSVAVGSVAVALVAAAALRFGTEVGREILAKRRLRQIFSGYVSPAVMTELEAGRLDGMESARCFVCVLFMDVRDFTTRSERETPEHVTSVLNRLFESATEVIHGRGGTVKEFMGDGVMAFFGAPGLLENPAQSAFEAGCELLDALPTLNEDLVRSGAAPVVLGIGLACGEAVVGHIGAASRHAYGAVGDCVNIASRLEGLTKALGMPLVLSASVRARLKEPDGLVSLGEHPIKGRGAVEVFGWRPSGRAIRASDRL